MIKFRHYEDYPDEIMEACQFRDEYDALPDGAFFAIAEEKGLTHQLEIMADWEWINTDMGIH